MRFTYIHRDATGAKRSGEIEAKDRADCFAKLKAQGISPMRVEEAKGGVQRAICQIAPTGNGAMGTRRPAGRRVAVFAALLAIALAAVCIFLAPRPNAPEPKEEGKPVKRSAPVATVTPSNAPEAKPEVKKATAAKADARKEVPPDTPWVNIYTNARGEEVRVGRDGKRVAMLKAWQRRQEEERKHPQKRVFRHTAEAYMAMFLNPAEAVPPPPDDFTNEQVTQMLVEKIEIDPENDTPDEIRQKEGVQKMKEELKEWIKDGGTFDSYLRELQKRQNIEAGKMFEARRMISEAMEKGNVDEARELYDAINRHFDEQGMPHVNVAPKYRKLLNQPKAEGK